MFVEPLPISAALLASGDGDRWDVHWVDRALLSERLGRPWTVEGVRTTIGRTGEVRGLTVARSTAAGGRFLTCVAGRAAFVVADLREHSATVGRWIPQELDVAHGLGVYVPNDLACGWQALTDGTVMLELRDGPATAMRETDPFDPVLNIAWPLPPR